MELCSGKFETGVDDGRFEITIRQETNNSVDGGYTFEPETSTYLLTERGVRMLMLELKIFIKENYSDQIE